MIFSKEKKQNQELLWFDDPYFAEKQRRLEFKQKQERVRYKLANDPAYKWWEDAEFVTGAYDDKLISPY